MTMHRYEARADLVPGTCERMVDGHPAQLVTLTLTDSAPVRCPTAQTTSAPT
jgi:hypothetical protein